MHVATQKIQNDRKVNTKLLKLHTYNSLTKLYRIMHVCGAHKGS